MLKYILFILFNQLFIISQAQSVPWFVYVPEIRESLKKRSIVELHLTQLEQDWFNQKDDCHSGFEFLKSNFFLDSEGFVRTCYNSSTSIEVKDPSILKDKTLFKYLLDKEYFMDSSQHDFIRENCKNVRLYGCTKFMNFAVDTSGLQYFYSNPDFYNSDKYDLSYKFKLNEVNYFDKNRWNGRSVWEYSGDDWEVYKNYSHLFNQNDSVLGIKMNYTKLLNKYDFPGLYKDTVAYSSLKRMEENVSFESIEEVKTYLKRSKISALNEFLNKVGFKKTFDTLVSQSIRLEKKKELIWIGDCIKAEKTKGKTTITDLFIGFKTEKNRLQHSSLFSIVVDHYLELEEFGSSECWIKLKTIKRNDGTVKSRVCEIDLNNERKKFFEERYDRSGKIICTEIFVEWNYSYFNRLDFLDFNIKNELGVSFNLGMGKFYFSYDEFDLLNGILNDKGKFIFSISKSEILDNHLLDGDDIPKKYKIYNTYREHKYNGR